MVILGIEGNEMMFEERKKIQENFRQEMLNTHNYLRQLHRVPPLILDEQLTENAQAHADYLAQQDTRLMPSNRRNRLGENLYSTTATDPIHRPDADGITRIWYSEIVNYNFEIPSSLINTGHFTQIVWKDTKHLGVGLAFAREGRRIYVVAQYSPPGNYPRAFRANVLPLK